MTGPVRKLAGFVPISAELLGDLRGYRPSPEEQARRDRAAADAAAHLAARLARHARLLDVVTGPRREILAMHGPERSSAWASGYVCGGCEFGGYDAEAPEWPCSTWVIAAEGEW